MSRAARSREPKRIAAARRRRLVAKISLATLGALGFPAWMWLARANYPGHPKHPLHPLAIPPPMYDVVRKNLLQAGIVAPATAPPDATTSTS